MDFSLLWPRGGAGRRWEGGRTVGWGSFSVGGLGLSACACCCAHCYSFSLQDLITGSPGADSSMLWLALLHAPPLSVSLSKHLFVKSP